MISTAPPRRGLLPSGPLALALGVLLAGCANTVNLTRPGGPGFEGHYAPESVQGRAAAPIRIVSFNIKYGQEIDRAIGLLRGDSLMAADLLALQEMDEVGVERIARALHMDYAYYPAAVHPVRRRYFGPAVLSRWPIERSWKLLLPHAGWTRGQRRTATAAVVRIRDVPVLVYAVHLETPVQITAAERRDQVTAVLADADRFRMPVVIAGDFNSEAIGVVLKRRGYAWHTELIGPTISWFSWDHIFTRGFPRGLGRGVVHEVHGASDHRPVWAVVVPPGGRYPAARSALNH